MKSFIELKCVTWVRVLLERHNREQKPPRPFVLITRSGSTVRRPLAPRNTSARNSPRGTTSPSHMNHAAASLYPDSHPAEARFPRDNTKYSVHSVFILCIHIPQSHLTTIRDRFQHNHAFLLGCTGVPVHCYERGARKFENPILASAASVAASVAAHRAVIRERTLRAEGDILHRVGFAVGGCE